MITFTTTIERYGQQGEKTGWTFCLVPAAEAQRLKPNNKRSFRVKGFLDHHALERVALIPVGGGDFIIPLNAEMRKGIGKNLGAALKVQLEMDTSEILAPDALIECLKDEPAAWLQYNRIAPSHRLYFIKWISSAKTEVTSAKRIAQTVTALAAGKDYGAMLRTLKEQSRKDL
jgi:hypothetical protein